MILDDIVRATRTRLTASQAAVPLTSLKQQIAQLPPLNPDAIVADLRGPQLSIIAEIKHASPSKGEIVAAFPYQDIARAYTQAQVSAISVLTEPDFFHGHLKYLQEVATLTSVPLLRKDFVIDSYMLYEARAAGASIALLIVAILTPQQLRDYIALAAALGLAAIVEAHDEQEISTAIAAGAAIIGVNNRNLKDFTVDFANSIRLRAHVPADIAFIAESGIQNRSDVAQLEQAGIHAVLIGETLMRAPDKPALVRALRGN